MPTPLADNSLKQVREDFDRIALLTEPDAEARGPHTEFLLKQIPPGCGRLLEVGCGLGGFSRLAAGRARNVTAVDLSPQMIRLAREHSAGHPNIEFLLGDFLRLELPPGSYDCVVTNATLHHMEAAEALPRMKSLLRPGGVLVVHDILDSDGLLDLSLCLVRFPLSAALRFLNTGRMRANPELKRAYLEHGRNETYLKFKDVLAMRDQFLPGGEARRHLLWRYTIIWRKPGAGVGG